MSRKVRIEDCTVCEHLTREGGSGRRSCSLRNITLNEIYYGRTEADCPKGEDDDLYLGSALDPSPVASMRLRNIIPPRESYLAEIAVQMTYADVERTADILTYIHRLLIDVYFGKRVHIETDDYEVCDNLLFTCICKLHDAASTIGDAMRADHEQQITAKI